MAGLRPENSGEASSGDCVVSRICYNVNYRKAEREMKNESEKKMEQEYNIDGDSETVASGDKYLIFTTGYKTYSPHQIGITISS